MTFNYAVKGCTATRRTCTKAFVLPRKEQGGPLSLQPSVYKDTDSTTTWSHEGGEIAFSISNHSPPFNWSPISSAQKLKHGWKIWTTNSSSNGRDFEVLLPKWNWILWSPSALTFLQKWRTKVFCNAPSGGSRSDKGCRLTSFQSSEA